MIKDDIFNGCGIEVNLENPDNFLKIVETLQRIGVASKKEKTLTQSCHILHKRGRYAILHFKELFILDGKSSNFSDDDRIRRDTITDLLEQWKLLTVINDENMECMDNLTNIRIIPYKEKKEWNLVSKYTIGK